MLYFSRRWALIVFLLFLGNLGFFRDPVRVIPPGNNPVSPADGRIVDVTKVYEGRYLKEEAVKIAMFLSVFNVHIARTPIDGKVEYSLFQPGQFLNAANKKSAEVNECHWLGVANANHRILAQLVSGAIAHRIHCDVNMEQALERGQKIGIICYGSRVECYIPSRYFKPTVKVGDRVKAGESILGEWTL